MKKIIKLLITIPMFISLCACSSNEEKGITIAYQYGVAYNPVIIIQEKHLIEEEYKKLTGEDIGVNWIQMSSGSDINTGIMTGDIDVGFMGVAPAITGIAKGLNYRIFTNISGQEHGLMTNKNYDNLEDIINNNDQIALVSLGSIQHIILAKALVDNCYDAHALDSNIVGMKHPDGMSSLQSGNISCHLTSSPYIYLEKADNSLKEIVEINKAWTKEKSFIVGITTDDIHDNNYIYSSITNAVNEAINMINNDVETAASITYIINGNSLEDEIGYLDNGVYTTETNGLYELAKFMIDNNFCEGSIKEYKDLVFDEVKGN